MGHSFGLQPSSVAWSLRACFPWWPFKAFLDFWCQKTSGWETGPEGWPSPCQLPSLGPNKVILAKVLAPAVLDDMYKILVQTRWYWAMFWPLQQDDMYKTTFLADHFNSKFWLLWENNMYKIAFLADSFNSLAIQRRLHKQKIFSFHFQEISCLLREVSLLLGKRKV